MAQIILGLDKSIRINDSRPNDGLFVRHYFSDKEYAKEIRLDAGCSIGQHSHKFSHISILAEGTVLLTAGEMVTMYDAPSCIVVEAGVEHSITAITDAVWYCVHATDEKDPDAADRDAME